LRWAGLRGPHVTTQEIADERRVSRQIVSRWIVDTINAAPIVDLTPAQLTLLSEATLPRQDPRLRARRARLFDRPPPPALPAGTARGWRRWNDIALRVGPHGKWRGPRTVFGRDCGCYLAWRAAGGGRRVAAGSPTSGPMIGW